MLLTQYINSFEGHTKDRLIELQNTIFETNSNINSKIIWGLPTFYYKDVFLLQIRIYNDGIGFYSGYEVLEAFKDELDFYEEVQKSTIKFPLNVEIPKELISKMVKFKIKNM